MTAAVHKVKPNLPVSAVWMLMVVLAAAAQVSIWPPVEWNLGYNPVCLQHVRISHLTYRIYKTRPQSTTYWGNAKYPQQALILCWSLLQLCDSCTYMTTAICSSHLPQPTFPAELTFTVTAKKSVHCLREPRQKMHVTTPDYLVCNQQNTNIK